MTRSHRFVSFLFFLAALAGLLLGLVGPSLLTVRAAPHLQASPAILISEFRTRGPGGASDEFIELYNPTNNPANIGGWFLKASDAFNSTIDLATIPSGTVLAPGQYYLAVNFGGYSGTVPPDVVFSPAFPDNGGIAVLDAGQNIIDQVGMSNGSLYKEPPVLAPLTGDVDQSYERGYSAGGSNNCVDTGNNRTDFSLRTPGDPQNSSSPLNLCGQPVAPTTTTLIAHSPDPSVVGESVQVQYQVTSPAGTPAGNVVVSAGTDSCTGTVAAGQCSIVFTSAGSKNLKAAFIAQGNFAGSESGPVAHNVNPADTATTITSDDPDPSTVGQSVTVHFAVQVVNPGSGIPAGNVNVSAGTKSCTGSLANGAGQCVLAFDSIGTKTLTASYQGNANFNASNSAVEPHTVEAAPPTLTPTSTSIAGSSLSVIINEIAWSGTSASANDEWIELHNTTSSVIDLSGWRLRALDGDPNILLTGKIPARGYYLLERRESAVSDITADQIYTGTLSNTGERLYLYNAKSFIVDYANTYSTTWLAGSVNNHRSMERRAVVVDSRTSWVTNTGVVRNGKDADGNPINGTPKRQNWAFTVTLTPSPRPTLYPSRTPPPQPRPVINEFLPRAGFDWNQDGKVDVFDEYIEVANLGPVNINLRGWRLDDRADGGSNPYTLPDMTLKPGERALFFGLQTNILLSDGGDTVRLLSPAGVIFDSQTYPVVKTADQSWCRLPDLRGSWYPDCFPTPNLPNERRGQLPSLPPGTGLEEPLCHLADTLPEEFVLAECHGFGEDMWNSSYWDNLGWKGDRPVLQNGSKWETIIE